MTSAGRTRRPSWLTWPAPAVTGRAAADHGLPADAGGHRGELDALRRQLVTAARHLHGAKVLAESIYGVGPITALALTCWLGGAGRFTSARKAVRFAGLDITVRSPTADARPVACPGRGRRCCAGQCMRRARPTPAPAAPDHRYYAAVKDRKDGKRAALPEARKIIRRACHIVAELGDDALATV